jgi:hypothetical protein
MTNAIAKQDQVPVAESTAILQVIERAATNPAVDIDKMERLLQMQERVIARNAEAAYNSAFAEMQEELPEITERGEIKVNGQTRSKYALFEDINDAVKPVLKKHGFAMSFRTHIADNAVTVTGILMHKAGHREETTISLPADNSGSKNSVQAIGSSIQYGKRYAMCALINITSRGEDDDGMRAGAAQRITENQAADLKALAEEVGADVPAFLKYLSRNGKVTIENIEGIPAAMYADAVAALNAKRKKAPK